MPPKVTHYIFLIRNILIVDAVYNHSVILVNQCFLLEIEFFVKKLTVLKRIYFYLFINPQYLQMFQVKIFCTKASHLYLNHTL